MGILAQQQLLQGYLDASMKTAMRLCDYEDIVSPREIYSLIAVTAFFNKYFGLVSKAFIKLESLDDNTPDQREAYQDLALSIFTKFSPIDPTSRTYQCTYPGCTAELNDWNSDCPQCPAQYPADVVTGRPIFDNRNLWTCRQCRHKAYEHEVRGLNYCPLCHSPI